MDDSRPNLGPKTDPKTAPNRPSLLRRRPGLPPNAGMLALSSSRRPPGPPRAPLHPLLGRSGGPLQPLLAPFGRFSGRFWLILGSVLAISDLLLWQGAKVKRASIHITDPLVTMTSRRPIDTDNIDQPHGIPEPNKRWDGGEMEHAEKTKPTCGGSCIIFGMCIPSWSRLRLVR